MADKRTMPKALKAIMDHKGTTLPMEGNFQGADELLQSILEALHLDPEMRDGFERLIRQYGDFRVQEEKG
jgi:hypothetical protein